MLAKFLLDTSQEQTGFWTYQLKDLVTGLIAAAALVTSLTGVWVGYLRPRKLRCDLGEKLRLFYTSKPNCLLRIFADVYALNTGAKPGVITRMNIEISDIARKGIAGTLYWREFTKTENIAGKGEPRKIWTSFAGLASPVLVPKYDACLVEAGFLCDDQFALAENATYELRLLVWIAGRNGPIKSPPRRITTTDEMLHFLATKATGDSKGIVERHLNLTSNDGVNFTYQPNTHPNLESLAPHPANPN
jgi:hypothetical protein